jgi:hypothetical protein
MADFASLQFEIERRVILFKPTTSMPGGSQLGYNADPNLITSPSTPGEQLLYYCPNDTRYAQFDLSGNVLTEWYKKAQPNGWLPLGGGTTDASGTSSPTFQLNNLANGVVIQDSSGNLVVRAYDGSLGTLIVGNLRIDNLNGYLRALDGSIYADPSIYALKAINASLNGDDITHSFVIPHNLNTINHVVSVYDMLNQVVYTDIIVGYNSDTIAFSSIQPTGTDHRAVIIGF